MLNIVCVKWGDAYGPEYVNILYDMIIRNMRPRAARFICFTDNPNRIDPNIEVREFEENLSGWWNKLALFKQGVFPEGEQVLFLDLDTLIVGNFDEIANATPSFAILRDFYQPDLLQSAVMSWTVGPESASIWNRWIEAGKPEIDGGDQAWIESCSLEYTILQDIFPYKFSSYKADGLKRGVSVVCFHGQPKPHNCLDPMVARVWKIGGVTAADIDTYCNIPDNILLENILKSSKRPYPWIKETTAHDKIAVIVGSAPSLLDQIDMIKLRARNGHEIFALNNAAKILNDNGVVPAWQIILDARPENVGFIKSAMVEQYLFASQADETVFDAALKPVTLFHADIPGLRKQFPNEPLVGGGTTVLTRAMVALHIMGYRYLHLYGVDSSFRGEQHHAVDQPMNSDKASEVFVQGQRFASCPWMIAQVNEFQMVSAALAEEGSEITVHGDGLLPFVAQCMMAA